MTIDRNGHEQGASSEPSTDGSPGDINRLERRDFLFQTIVESLGDGILIVDQDSRVVLANNAFLDMWSLERGAITTATSTELAEMVKDQLTEPDLFLNRVHELSDADHESVDELALRDGRVLERVNRPLHGYDRASGRLLVFRDVTDRRVAEEARRSLENQARDAQKLESLGALAGGIAHEFNNLLMTILGNADLLKRDLPLDEGPAESLAEIEGAGRRAADLCNQMLAFSGRGRYSLQPLDLGQVINEIRGLLTLSVAPNVHLTCRFDADLPEISADAMQLRQLVLNLVGNAADACARDGGSIFLHTGVTEVDRAWLTDCVTGTDLRPGRYVFLEVRDTGSGMSETVRQRAFEPFYSTKLVGRGLGLPAVLGIVRGHDGALKLTSETGRGTTCMICFAAAPKAAEVDAEPVHERAHGAGRTVLLVEDEVGVRRVCREILERTGFPVLTADDGVVALDICEEKAGEMGCVVLDLTMPNMGGQECFEHIHARWPDLPIVLTSGYAEQEATLGLPSCELAGFLQKPFDPMELVKLVQSLVAAG